MVGPVGNQGLGGQSSTPLSTSHLNLFSSDTISSLAYLNQVAGATSDNKRAQYAADRTNNQVLINLYQAFAETSAVLQKLFNEIQDAVAEWTNLVANEHTMENAVTTYNGTVSSAVTAMNSAIDTYNNIVPPTAQSQQDLQDAQSNYQQTMDDATATYNQAVTTFNTQTKGIKAVNADLAALGQPPLTSGQLPVTSNLTGTVPGVTPTFVQDPPIGSLSTQSVPDITISPAPPSDLDVLRTVFTPAALAAIRTMNNVTQQTKLYQGLLILQQTLSQLQGVALPAAFYSRHYQAFMSSLGAPSLGTGPSLVASTSLVDDPELAGILSNAAYEDVYQRVTNRGSLPASIVTQLQLLTLQILSNEAANAGTQVAESGTGSGGAPPQGAVTSPAEVTGTALFGANILLAVSNGSTQAAIQALLARNDVALHLSDQERSKLVTALAAVLNLTLLRLAASQIAVTLRAPGLFSSILGNAVSGGTLSPDLAARITNERLQPSPRRTLARSTTKLALIDQVAKQLTGATVGRTVLSADAARNLAAGIVNTVAARRDITNQAQLASAFQEALTQAGVVGPLNASVASSAAGFVNTESILPFLDRSFQINAPQSQALLAQLENTAPQQGNAISAAFNATLNANTNNPFVNIREFRSTFEQNLIANGVTGTQASGLANQAAQFVAPAENENPVIGGGTSLTQSEFIDGLNSLIAGRLSGNPGATVQAVTAQVDDTALSIVRAYSKNLAEISDLIKEDNIRRDIVHSETHPTLGHVVLAHRFNEITHTQANAVLAGLNPADQAGMRNNTTLLNPKYLHSVDIQI